MGSGQSISMFVCFCIIYACSEKETFEHGVGPKVNLILSAMILKGIPLFILFIFFLGNDLKLIFHDRMFPW